MQPLTIGVPLNVMHSEPAGHGVTLQPSSVQYPQTKGGSSRVQQLRPCV